MYINDSYAISCTFINIVKTCIASVCLEVKHKVTACCTCKNQDSYSDIATLKCSFIDIQLPLDVKQLSILRMIFIYRSFHGVI